MPAAAIGTAWEDAPPSWSVTAWEEATWAEAVRHPIAIDESTVALVIVDETTVALRSVTSNTLEWDMTLFGQTINELVAGDDIEIRRTITGVPESDTLAKAWLTIKSLPTDDDPGLLQKVVTSSFVAGQGQISDTGADTVGEVFFELEPADGATIGINVKRVYDIQVKTTAGNIYTAEVGTIILTQGVTASTS